MKRYMSFLVVAILAMCYSFATYANGIVFIPDITPCHSGSWYDPATSGEGITMEVLDEDVIVYFYRPGDNPEWYVFVGSRPPSGPFSEPNSKTVELISYQPMGIGDVRENGVGMITIIDDNTLIFSYYFELDFRLPKPIPWCLGCSDSFTYTRLTQTKACS